MRSDTGMKVRQVPGKEMPKDNTEPWLEMEDFGKPPILCEVIEAEVALKTNRKNLVVWAVNAEGIFVGNVPTKYEDGVLKFTLGAKHPSVYYLIQAE